MNNPKIRLEVDKRSFYKLTQIFKDDKPLLKSMEHRSSIEVTEDWIFVYGTIGGTGTGYSRGQVIRKINISNSEFEEVWKEA